MNLSLAKCDCCDVNEYSTSVRGADTYRQFEFEDDFENLCNDCAEEQNTLTADTMEDAELIAAIVSDSIGYAGPYHAARHVSDYREGREAIEAEGRRYGCWCERGSACFKNDLDALIESAVRHWGFKSDEERERLLAKVERWQEIESDDRLAGMALSLAAPVGGI
ncbi:MULTISPECIES: hypothetical protein [unclassified Halorubrum]|uniref:hypothetical protein n=1 Tax=unclassified Halorubrum TaxID=2642239 RepID=UPI00190D7491|nr:MULTISPECIES: hypothetical protein [unclassified Halorubrum]